MNALLEQFLSEAREALQGIGEKLMELESAPDDQELMTRLFRLVHTLKGNSGLFEFPEMTRVLHAGEDLMDAVRNGHVPYSQALADRLLDAMDFVGSLCNDIEAERATPASVGHDAVALARALRELIGVEATDQNTNSPTSTDTAGGESAAGPDAATLLRVPEAVRQAAWRQMHSGQNGQSSQSGATLFWVRYVPAEECFFQGEDPLHQAKLTPGLLWGAMTARAAWPPLKDLDAYHCALDFDVLAATTRADLNEHYRYVPDQVQILAVAPHTLIVPQGDSTGGTVVYEDFIAVALGFLDKGDLSGLALAVRSMLELSNSTSWLSSDLRWIQVLMESEPLDTQAIRALIEALRTLNAPDWSAPAQPAAAPDFHDQIHDQTIVDVVEVQREILSLPDDATWLDGRIKAAAASLSACLRACGRSSEEAVLNLASAQALQAHSSLALAQWLETAFPSAFPGTWQHQSRRTKGENAPVPIPVHIPVLIPLLIPVPIPEPQEGEVRFSRRAEDVNSVKSLKVDQAKVDRLMNLIGEMVVAKNAIPYLATRAEMVYGVRDLSREIKTQYAVINRISEEMQDAIMQVRMMPVSFVMQRFPRLVRETSRKLGKEVSLVLEGQETAADKNIIESLGDPLVHIVRNSLDHGLELPEVRLAAGKPAIGTLKIIARQESDRVLIEIIDDGKGIDPAVIKKKAYEKGLIDENTLERISDQDAMNLVFAAGLSTVETISDLSGRGVGMDVVRTAVERVNGTISLDSVKGKGTRIGLSLPLSMAVSNVMTIESNGQMFGVPMDVVVETVRVPSSAVRRIKHSQATVLRDRLVPLIALNTLLGMAAPPLANDDDELATLVVRVGESTVGLLVDNFHSTADIILKPLAGVLGQLKAYAGSALMGDGSVLMVLNVKEML